LEPEKQHAHMTFDTVRTQKKQQAYKLLQPIQKKNVSETAISGAFFFDLNPYYVTFTPLPYLMTPAASSGIYTIRDAILTCAQKLT